MKALKPPIKGCDKVKHKDKIIIELLFERDESALEMIQSLYGNLIRSIAFNLFKSDTVAEECLNDTLLAIWDSIPPEKPDSLSAYAGSISRRKAIDRYRRETAQKRYIPESSHFSQVEEELGFCDDFSEDVVRQIELKRVMNAFLTTLSPTNREIFMCRYFDFMSLDTIASRMHISKSRINAKLFRMRQKLEEMLRKEGIEE